LDQNHDYENTCTRYLLGELTESEQEQFEEAYFGDDLLFERFLAVKDDLIDSYARHELAGPKRERFEQHFLATASRRERVDSAREFIRAVSARPHQESGQTETAQSKLGLSPWQSFLRLFGPGRLVAQVAFAGLLLVAVVGLLVLFKRQRDGAERLRQEAAARQQQEEQDARPVGPAPTSGLDIGGQRSSIANSQPSPTPPVPSHDTNRPAPLLPAQVASLSLIPFSSRADDSTPLSLKLGPETRLVRLSLIFKDNDHRSYDVTIRTVEGESVVHQRRLKVQKSPEGQRVMVTFDSAILRGQDYIITLNGLTPTGNLEAINDYHLRVERNPR
jgi:hypothetical protein